MAAIGAYRGTLPCRQAIVCFLSIMVVTEGWIEPVQFCETTCFCTQRNQLAGQVVNFQRLLTSALWDSDESDDFGDDSSSDDQTWWASWLNFTVQIGACFSAWTNNLKLYCDMRIPIPELSYNLFCRFYCEFCPRRYEHHDHLLRHMRLKHAFRTSVQKKQAQNKKNQSRPTSLQNKENLLFGVSYESKQKTPFVFCISSFLFQFKQLGQKPPTQERQAGAASRPSSMLQAFLCCRGCLLKYKPARWDTGFSVLKWSFRSLNPDFSPFAAEENRFRKKT